MSEVTSDAISPHTIENEWNPQTSDLKKYKHFDSLIHLEEIVSLVRDKDRISQHSFRPLLHFEKKWRRAPKNKVKQKPKIRPIRYACRKDAYIYKHYREILSGAFEQQLKCSNLQDNILAYRRIPIDETTQNCKSNIHFAKHVFDIISELGNCCAIAIDISDFFGSIDHVRLKQVWQNLLGCDHLPDDHFSVYQSITQYRYVDYNDVLVALGYSSRNNDGKLSYKCNPKKIPLQLCSPKDYREKIIQSGLVQKHTQDYGIPQGTPISDLLANAYLHDFDRIMKKYISSLSGHYFRYSDDILMIFPTDESVVHDAFSKAQAEITKMGSHLHLKPKKNRNRLLRIKLSRKKML